MVGVIVPVYNAEKKLCKCIDSILSQTCPNWDLLLIDDGSSDSSGTICDDYAARDKRVRIFHKQNGGVGSARNLGLKNAVGEYVIHCDADDFIEPTMLEALLVCAEKENADMVYCDYYEETKGQVRRIPQSSEDVSAKGLIHAMLSQKAHGCSWNKLIRRSLLEKSDLMYSETFTCYEDLFFNIQLLLRNPNMKIAYLPKACYHYCQDDGSITHGNSCEILYQRVCGLISCLTMELKMFGYDLSDLYTFKKDALRFLNWAHQYDMMLLTYPEIHKRLLQELPWTSQFAFALRGYPRIGGFVNKLVSVLK